MRALRVLSPLGPSASLGVESSFALMACRLVALDKRPGMRPVGIGETLRHALAKLVMREYGDQAKMVCGNLQLCEGLNACIEGATQAVVQ